MIPDEKPHGLWVHDENHAKEEGFFPTVLGQGAPSYSKTIFAKKRYTSISARALGVALSIGGPFLCSTREWLKSISDEGGVPPTPPTVKDECHTIEMHHVFS